MKKFFRINPETGKCIFGNVIVRDNAFYYYRDMTTKRFVSHTEIKKRYDAYKASLERKDERISYIRISFNEFYTNAERMLLKTACGVEICGVRTDENNFKYYAKYANKGGKK